MMPTQAIWSEPRWQCFECGADGHGEKPDACPNCGHDRVDQLIDVDETEE